MTSQTLSEFQRQKIMHKFDLLDLDKNGVIELDDFQRVVEILSEARQFGPDDPARQRLTDTNMNLWKALYTFCDTDKNGSITPEEWLNFHTEALITARDSSQIVPGFESTIAAFTSFIHDLLDADGDGLVTEEDYLQLSRAQGINDVDSLKIFDRIDQDRDSKLTLEEVSNLVRDFYLSEDPEALGNEFFGYLK